MRGTLSPILTHLIQTTIASVGEKEKIDRLINKYRKMLSLAEGSFNVSEIRFGLADLLITRDESGDWKEAKNHYDFVLEKATYGYLRAAAMIGKAELSIRSVEKDDLEKSIELSHRAYKKLLELVGETDFYSIKCLVVEAELRLKRSDKTDKSAAMKLFEKVFTNDMADPYFKARAIVNHAELYLYSDKTDIEHEIQLCHSAIEYLKDRPDDYFVIKAKLLQGEFIMQRMAHYDKSRATGIFMGIIGNKNADVDLVARAKLNLAEISEKEKALKLVGEVLNTKVIDKYLLERAKQLKTTIEKRKVEGK